jgi:hypothetical protein
MSESLGAAPVKHRCVFEWKGCDRDATFVRFFRGSGPCGVARTYCHEHVAMSPMALIHNDGRVAPLLLAEVGDEHWILMDHMFEALAEVRARPGWEGESVKHGTPGNPHVFRTVFDRDSNNLTWIPRWNSDEHRLVKMCACGLREDQQWQTIKFAIDGSALQLDDDWSNVGYGLGVRRDD